jgi:hypothetical protein
VYTCYKSKQMVRLYAPRESSVSNHPREQTFG